MYGAQCTERTQNWESCAVQIDSVNSYWKEVIKNIVKPDSVFMHDTTFISITLPADTIYLTQIDTIISTITKFDTLYLTQIDTVNLSPISKEITIDSIKVDSFGSTLIPYNLTDNKLYYDKKNKGSRWGARGYPHQALFYFDTVYVVTSIWINVYGWNEGYQHDVEIYNWGQKYASFKTDPLLWSKHKLFLTAGSLYINILGGQNNWTDIGEIKVFGYKQKD